MRVIPDRIEVVCDVDYTLIRPTTKNDRHLSCVEIINPNSGLATYYTVHHQHVELLRRYKGRGFYITVWSANGSAHAESVVKALDLEDVVDEVKTKPFKHIDDKKDAKDIVGSHVFIPEEGFNVV